MKFLKRSKKKTNWKHILIVVILAVLVGGGLFWRFQLKDKMQPKDIVDDRILLTKDTIHEIWEKEWNQDIDRLCNTGFNNDSPTTEVLYSSKEKGISLGIPYNPGWGSKKYKISPYFEDEDGLSFGPIILSENCSWSRVYFVDLLPLQNSKEITSSLIEMANRYGPDEGPLKDTIIEKKINNLTVVEYIFIDGLLGPIPQLKIIGKKYNYQFSCLCGNGTNELEKYFEFFEDIIKTIQFIEE